MFDLGEDLLDRVQVRRIFRQEEQLGASSTYELTHGFALVAAEIVDDDEVVWHQGRDEDLLDVCSEALAVDRAVENPWSVDAVMAQGSQEGGGLPAAVRNLGFEPHAARCPAPQRRHVGLGPGLVNEDQTLRRDPVLIFDPLRPPASDVGTVAFPSHHGFF